MGRTHSIVHQRKLGCPHIGGLFVYRLNSKHSEMGLHVCLGGTVEKYKTKQPTKYLVQEPQGSSKCPAFQIGSQREV